MRRRLSLSLILGVNFGLLLGALALPRGLAPGGAAWAGAVKGTLSLPSELKSGERRYPGYVRRLENGLVPVAPAPARGDTVVVLEGPKGAPPPARTVTIELAALAASPSTVVVGEGSVLEFKNSDRVAHDLSTPGQSSLMPLERLKPGAVRRQKFLAAGGYVVRDAEYPQIAISVIVVGSPYFAVVDEKGAFKLPEAPDGKATLKVWSQGRWVHEQEIDTGRSGDLQVKVAAAGPKSGE